MKAAGTLTGTMLLLLLLLQPGTAAADPRDPLTGRWEGTFMGDFRTIIEFAVKEPDVYSGKILMFSGPQLIQDDPITEIRIHEYTVTFMIPAKESSFEGELTEETAALSGRFLFPDGSVHPIELVRTASSDGQATSSKSLYLEYHSKRLEPQAMKEDLHYLVTTLQEIHPRLYKYTSEEMFDSEVEHILLSLDTTLSLEEYYLHIAPVTDMVHCSHTGIRLPAEYRQRSMEYGQFLPLSIRCEGMEGYFLYAHGVPAPEVPPPGVRILNINGVPFDRIVRQLLTLVPSEGTCRSAGFHELNRHFQWYYHFLDPSPTFMVEFQNGPSSVMHSLIACSLVDIDPELSAPERTEPLAFRMTENRSAGILTVPSFEIRDMEGYLAELERIFRILKQQAVPYLILDLRGNRGGHPIFAAQLLSYLSPEDFTYFLTNPDIPDFEPLYHPMHPDPDAYSGALFILVDGGCLSTTGHLISQIRAHTGGVFVGEEPGSTNICNDLSNRIILPNSGLEVNIPGSTFETSVTEPGQEFNFALDHPVPIEPGRLAAEEDEIMQFCLEMVANP